jgi:lysozyme
MRSLKKLLPATALVLSLAGVGFIQSWEGTEEVAYLDSVGVPTICTGSTRNVFIGQRASLADCEQRLLEDTSYAGKAVQRCVQARLTQGQYDALVSLSFNIGGGATCTSTLVRKLNQGDCRGAAEQFLRWDHAGGKRLRGLTNRRAAESAQFIRDC